MNHLFTYSAMVESEFMTLDGRVHDKGKDRWSD